MAQRVPSASRPGCLLHNDYSFGHILTNLQFTALPKVCPNHVVFTFFVVCELQFTLQTFRSVTTEYIAFALMKLMGGLGVLLVFAAC